MKVGDDKDTCLVQQDHFNNAKQKVTDMIDGIVRLLCPVKRLCADLTRGLNPVYDLTCNGDLK